MLRPTIRAGGCRELTFFQKTIHAGGVSPPGGIHIVIAVEFAVEPDSVGGKLELRWNVKSLASQLTHNALP
jgi:hypothetical protein